MSATFYAVHSGSGSDDVCKHCLEDAIRERRHQGNSVSWAALGQPSGLECAYCGRMAS